MKKNLLSMFAVAAGLLMATSCSTKQEEEVTVGGEAVVSFTAQLPSGVNNRAPQKTAEDGGTTTTATFGNGTKATRLQYAVYKVGTDGGWTYLSELGDDGKQTINLKTTVTLKLVNGQSYAVAFWADAPTEEGQKEMYTFSKEKFQITANYDNWASSNEKLDAFYGIKEFTVEGSEQHNIDLKRPFAQLNIGTGDLDDAKAAGIDITKAGVKVSVYSTLNLKDGSVSDAKEINFAQAALPEVDFPVDPTTYSYLTMNYLLVSNTKSSDNTVTISYDNAQDRVFKNVPLQRNYRTNIYGNLLTSMTTFNVEIKPLFEKEYTVYIEAKEPDVDEQSNTYLVKTANHWAWLGAQISVNKNIKLENDIDFEGQSVPAIKLAQFSPSSGNLVFDGNSKTLSNLTTLAAAYPAVGDKNGSEGHFANGLFTIGQWNTSVTIKDLTVKNIKVDCPHADNNGNYCGYAAAVCAYVSAVNDGVTISNVHVDGATVKGVQSVGAIIGNAGGSAPIKVTGCSVANTALSNYKVAGESGFVATIIGRVRGTNVTIESSAVKTGNTVDAWYADKESRGINSIDAVAAVDTKNNGKLTIDDATKATGAEEKNVKVNKTKIE